MRIENRIWGTELVIKALWAFVADTAGKASPIHTPKTFEAVSSAVRQIEECEQELKRLLEEKRIAGK